MSYLSPAVQCLADAIATMVQNVEQELVREDLGPLLTAIAHFTGGARAQAVRTGTSRTGA